MTLLAFLGGLALGLVLGFVACLALIDWCQRGLRKLINHTPKGK